MAGFMQVPRAGFVDDEIRNLTIGYPVWSRTCLAHFGGNNQCRIAFLDKSGEFVGTALRFGDKLLLIRGCAAAGGGRWAADVVTLAGCAIGERIRLAPRSNFSASAAAGGRLRIVDDGGLACADQRSNFLRQRYKKAFCRSAHQFNVCGFCLVHESTSLFSRRSTETFSTK